MKKERILVTGASSGIGLELATAAAADGHDLILVARSQGRLQQLSSELQRVHGTQSVIIPLDLGGAGAAQRLAASVAERGLQVDVLINNAGYGQHGAFINNDPADQRP